MKSRVLSGVVVAGVAFGLTGCGGSSDSNKTPSTVKSAVPVPSGSAKSGSTTGTSGVSSPSSSASAKVASGPDANVNVIQSAQIPADCQMPAQRLTAGKTPANQMPKQGAPVPADGENGPLLLDMANKGVKQVLWRYNCTAGGVNWPEVLVLSDAQGNLVGSLDLGPIAQSEHAQVSSWHTQGNDVVLTWEQYEGADFDKQTHQSVLSWTNGKLVLKDQVAAATGTGRPGVPAGAAPGAGGPRPSNATELTESSGSDRAFQTASGQNGCMATDAWVRCGSKATGVSEFFMDSNGKVLSGGDPPADDMPAWMMDGTPKLSYGQVRYYGNTVFASTDQGVTVWNTQSGHGALINTSGIHQF